MPKFSTSEIRIRGVFKKLTSDMKQKMIYLKKKLPLTQTHGKIFDIPLKENFKFHYQSAQVFLQDYKSYIINFLKQMKKTADQYILDINDVWSTVDSDMTLHLNQLKTQKT